MTDVVPKRKQPMTEPGGVSDQPDSSTHDKPGFDMATQERKKPWQIMRSTRAFVGGGGRI